MPLPKPTLDTRSFDQLVDEGRALIPRLAPLWTDHNYSDPGITLIDLMAWLTEMDLFRLDRVSDEQVRAFLRLVGVTPRAPQVAQAVLLLQAASEQPLPAGLQLAGGFQTQEAITVSSARLTQVLASDGRDLSAANTSAQPWLPFAGEMRNDTALYLGFDAPLASAGATLSLWVWTPDHVADGATRSRLIEEWTQATEARTSWCSADLGQLPSWHEHHDVRLRWEFHAGAGAWKPLHAVVDETRALTLTGPVRFEAPAGHVAGGPQAAGFWLRARRVAGRYECPRPLLRIGFNALRAAHASDADAVGLPASLGRAQAAYEIAKTPVVAGTTQLEVLLAGLPEGEWSEVANFDRSGPHDRHYVLEPERARLVFGDGRRGRVVPAGATQSVRLRLGGGVAGNVAAHTLQQWLDNVHNATLLPGWPVPGLMLEHPYAAAGGAAAETLKAATARAIAAQRDRTRAVNLDDIEALALDVPGVYATRAIAERHPAFPCWRAAGCITLVVVPDCAGPRPTPTPGLCAAVRRHLDRRRTPATELHVIGPSYFPVAVVASLQASTGALPGEVRATVLRVLERYFDPLRGGPDGKGWPIGRDVFRGEILALLAATPGVACVLELGLAGEGDAAPRCANLPLCDEALVVSGTHTITVSGAAPIRIVDRSIPHDCP
ncbi:MAG: putative baseplate assembly protein [Rhodanobacteraceae bacterium]|nr:putative baseplate assembly protein [Rhodanobacteraceae bacterium]